MRPYLAQGEWDRYKELFTTYKMCLFVGCMLQFFQQFIGINTVMYYGPDIIIDSGITLDGVEDKEQMGIILNIPLAATNAIGSTVAIFVIDNLGRRYIMLRSLPLIFLTLCLISLSMYLSLYSDDPSTVSNGHVLFFVSIILYLAFFSLGFSSTPWTVNSEIYPIHLVGTAVGLATATNWLSNFAVSSVFLTSMETDAGKVYTWLILAGFTIAAFVFIYFLLPETAGKKIRTNIKNIINMDIKDD
jgi:MFS family permease